MKQGAVDKEPLGPEEDEKVGQRGRGGAERRREGGREEKRKERIEKTRAGTQGLWEGTRYAVRMTGGPKTPCPDP